MNWQFRSFQFSLFCDVYKVSSVQFILFALYVLLTSFLSTEAAASLVDIMVLYCSEGGPDTEPYITPAGFQFLLLDTASQIWFFMLQYLETVQARLSFSLSSRAGKPRILEKVFRFFRFLKVFRF